MLQFVVYFAIENLELLITDFGKTPTADNNFAKPLYIVIASVKCRPKPSSSPKTIMSKYILLIIHTYVFRYIWENIRNFVYCDLNPTCLVADLRHTSQYCTLHFRAALKACVLQIYTLEKNFKIKYGSKNQIIKTFHKRIK